MINYLRDDDNGITKMESDVCDARAEFAMYHGFDVYLGELVVGAALEFDAAVAVMKAMEKVQQGGA